jgi:hypothetical protein
MPTVLVMWSNVNVKSARRVAVILLVAGSFLGAMTQSKARSSTWEAPSESCSATAMRDGINHAGRDVVTRVWEFGCEGKWAYVWADVAAGPNAIGITDVMVWRADLSEWRSVDRAVVCREELLPTEIYRKGCFSN